MGQSSDLKKSHVSLIVENRSILQIGSHLNTYQSIVGKEVGVTTKLFSSKSLNRTNIKEIPKGIKILGDKMVDLQIVKPDGEVLIYEMKQEESKNEVLYTAKLLANEPGLYISQVRMNGIKDGIEFYRTTQHLINVIEEDFELLSNAESKIVGDELIVTIFAKEKSKNLEGKKFKAYSEIWGTDKNNVKTPIAWVSGMVNSKKINDKLAFELKLNMKWISKANVKPDELRNCFVQHSSFSVTISHLNSIVLSTEKNFLIQKFKFNGIISEDMIMGHRPTKYQKNFNKRHLQGKVILTHGYCAGENPFTTEHFTNFNAFHDPNQSRTIDEFALKLKEHSSNFPEGVSFVSHSMGGHASLHLFSFYWSQTDLLYNYENRTKSNGYIIQTVGTPWLGSGLAGNLAELGRSLGIGCGNNKDLTYDGSKNWMTTVPKSARQEVMFYTTQYADWSWCNVAVNAVLTWPNDGTSENKYSTLPDGVSGGHKKSWCHTTGMSYPSQTTDINRNKILDANARRSGF